MHRFTGCDMCDIDTALQPGVAPRRSNRVAWYPVPNLTDRRSRAALTNAEGLNALIFLTRLH
jgi:hypothetical protein